MRKLPNKESSHGPTVRRGAVIPLVAVSSVVLVGVAALAIDSGVLYQARTELQASADAAALAAANGMLVERLRGTQNLSELMAAARNEAIAVAAQNSILGANPVVDGNLANDADGDVVFGHLANPNNLNEPLSFDKPDKYNTALVRIRRSDVRNGPVELYFARIFGINSTNMIAEAAAILEDACVGFNTPPSNGTVRSSLLPLALHIDAWRDLLAGTLTNGDHYAYNPDTGEVSGGDDGFNELNIYPGSGTGTQLLTPGNFGTVDIGNPNNSTADLSRQIRYGPNAADFAYFGGQLKLGPDGTVLLNADTGLSAGIKDDLAAIKGQPRTIPLFNRVAGNGNNSMFTIVGFAGIRIVNVRLTGSMKTKEVIIQPAAVHDTTVITNPGSTTSYSVYGPIRLVR